MLTLNMGVVDIPYATPPSEEGAANTATTGQVAGYLENKYHVMEIFYSQNEQWVADQLVDSLAGSLENILSGAPTAPVATFAEAESAIAEKFRAFLTLDTMATLGYPGVPTQAALDGVNHRLKSKHGPSRPSFIDTGTYQSSAKVWVE